MLKVVLLCGFLKLCIRRNGFRLSNELLLIIIAQGVAKMWPIKVGGKRQRVSPDLLSKKGFNCACKRFCLRPPTLTGHSFAAS